MNLFAIFLSALFAASSVAQNVEIGYPLNNAHVNAGTNITVEVDRPNSLTGSREVAIVIALQSCPTAPCFPPDQLLGAVLYCGPFNPQYHTGVPGKPPHQNFTVTIPPGIRGRNSLSITHLSLVGAGPFPYFEFRNVTVFVHQ